MATITKNQPHKNPTAYLTQSKAQFNYPFCREFNAAFKSRVFQKFRR